MDDKKMCCVCREYLTIDKFGKDKKRKDGLQIRCKLCRREESKQEYVKNGEKYRTRAKNQRPHTRNKYKELIQNIRTHYGCAYCNEKEDCCLDFHHLRDKQGHVTSMIGKSVGQICAEIAKCIVVCANCHRKIHGGLIVAEESKLCNPYTFVKQQNDKFYLM
jgi:hypothetical protein